MGQRKLECDPGWPGERKYHTEGPEGAAALNR